MNISQQTHIVRGAIADFQAQHGSTQDAAALHAHLQREVAGEPALEQALTLDVVRGLAAGADVRALLESAIGRQHAHQADVSAIVGHTLDNSHQNPTARASGNAGTFQASALASAQQSQPAAANAGASGLAVSGADAATRGATSVFKKARTYIAGGLIAATLAMAALTGGMVGNVSDQMQRVGSPNPAPITQMVQPQQSEQSQLAGLSAALARFTKALSGPAAQAYDADRALYADVYQQYVSLSSAAATGQVDRGELNRAGKMVIDLERSLVQKYQAAGFTEVRAQDGILHANLGAADAPTAAQQVRANDASGFAKSLAQRLGGQQQALDLLNAARPNPHSTSRAAIQDAADQLALALRDAGHYPKSATAAQIRDDLGIRTMRQLRDSPLLDQMQQLLAR